MKYFLSGHRDLSQTEFNDIYVPKIRRVLENDPKAEFVVGDYEGADIMSQRYLLTEGYGNRVTVYHMYDSPRYIASETFKTIGGFLGDTERDSAMTEDSDFDIAFYRGNKIGSGTYQNIVRRGII